MRLSITCCLALLIAACMSSHASGQIGATITYTSTQVGANYQYTFTVHNTGSTNIGTFWLGWTPSSLTFYPYDLLPSVATINSSPTGWAGLNVHDSPFGVDSIEWYDTGAALASGATLSNFTITTPDSPGTMAGASNLPGSYPVNTSWVYVGPLQNGGNFADPGALVSPTAVPEPAIGFLAPFAVFGLCRRNRR